MGTLKFFTINNLNNDPVFFFTEKENRDVYFKEHIDKSSRMFCSVVNISIMDSKPGMKLIIKD